MQLLRYHFFQTCTTFHVCKKLYPQLNRLSTPKLSLSLLNYRSLPETAVHKPSQPPLVSLQQLPFTPKPHYQPTTRQWRPQAHKLKRYF